MRFKNFTNLMYALLVVAGTVGFSGCSKDEDENQNPAVTSSNSASATIGTTNFTSTKMVASTESIGGLTWIELSYISQAGDTLAFGIEGTTTNTGQKYTYQIVPNVIETDYLTNYTKADGTMYIPSNNNKGEMTITLHDKTAKIIKGTFSRSLTSFDTDSTVVNITNGKFEAKY